MTDDGTAVPTIVEQLIAIITKKHPCQQDLGDEDDTDVLEESSEYDWLVVETAMETITCLSAALGSSFGELWKAFEKPMLKYTSSQENMERSMSVGSVAECILYMEEAVTPYTARLMQIFLKRLSDEDPETKSNAAYGTGLLCSLSGNEQEVGKHLHDVFEKLEPMFDEAGTARMRDNAAGCVSRIISRFSSAVPLGDILPRLVEILPLQEDFEENSAVFEMLVKLCKSYRPGEGWANLLNQL